MERNFQKDFSKKTLQDYEVVSLIGSGSFGTCFKVREKESGEVYAWKSIDYDELDDMKLENLISEINVLRQLKHPNIVQYFHHLNSNESKSIFIIMEWCEGGDLAKLISKARIQRKRFEEKYIWRVLLQICQALQECHNKLKEGSVIHRDIKPANIFLDSKGNVKLGDFGLARIVERKKKLSHTIVGTPYYMSPEVIKGSHYDGKSDVWAVGCLIYEMSALRPPFRGKKISQLSTNISNGKFSNIPQVYSPDLNEIIRFMLEICDEQRPSVEAVANHANVLRNANDGESNFTVLVDAEKCFYSSTDNDVPRTRLSYSFSSAISSNDDSCIEGSQRLSVSGVFTPDLRNEIFYSTNRRLRFKNFQQSDSQLYKNTGIQNLDISFEEIQKRPQKITENVLNELLQKRLHAIRAHELLLKQKEESLLVFEEKLKKKELHLQELQDKLDKKRLSLESKLKSYKETRSRKANNTKIEQCHTLRSLCIPQNEISNKQKHKYMHDETYCSIELQDTIQPTIAKLNLPALPLSKTLPPLRKVTFQSPKQTKTYDIENVDPKIQRRSLLKRSKNFRNSMCSSDGSTTSDSTTQRRKSLLSLLGMKRGNKNVAKEKCDSKPEPLLKTALKESQNILSKCETDKLTNIWTKENKQAAFDLLAAMNASEGMSGKRDSRSKTRHSLRVSTHSLNRNQMRQSLRLQT